MSNDYNYMVEQLIEYFRDVRMKYSYCPRTFISSYSYFTTVTVGVFLSALSFELYILIIYIYIYIKKRENPQRKLETIVV